MQSLGTTLQIVTEPNSSLGANISLETVLDGLTDNLIAVNAFAQGLVASVTSGNTSNIVITGDATNLIIDTALIAGGGGGGGGANVVTVNANDVTVLANALINFNNTASINVVASANGTYESNIAFTVNTAVTNTLAALAYSAANDGITIAVLAYAEANGGGGNASAAYAQANAAYGQANSAYAAANSAANSTVIVVDNFTPTANQTVFTLTANAAGSGYVIVAKNGIVQTPTTDYTVTGNVTLTMTSNCYVTDNVTATIFESVAIGSGGGGTPGGSNTQIQFNNQGAFAGSANLTFNVASNTLNFSSGGAQLDIPEPQGVAVALYQRLFIGTSIF